MFINFNFVYSSRVLSRSSLNRLISTSLARNQGNKRNYYDILKVKEDCTQKEIKTAFIELSKIHHPDMNESVTKNPNTSDNEFKEVLEAYTCLSKTHSRANYDLSLRGIHTVNYVTQDTVHRPYQPAGNQQEPVDNSDKYYGIKGIRKVANWKIVFACIIFCGLGIAAQILAIVKSATFKREKLDERSAIYGEMHKKTREKALNCTNQTNLERMLHRLKSSDEE